MDVRQQYVYCIINGVKVFDFASFKKIVGSYHSGIKQSPFEVLFGRKAQLGLTSSAAFSKMCSAEPLGSVGQCQGFR